MIGIIKVISTARSTVNKLVAKFLFLGGIKNGKGDTREAIQALPHGIDSRPIDGARGLYTTTQKKGAYYVFAYFYNGTKVEIGESRLFSTDPQGIFKFNVWATASGELLMGTSEEKADYTKNLVRFQELETGFNTLKSNFNSFVTAYNAHTHLVTVPGNPSGPALPQGVTSSATIADSKIDTIKVI